MILAPIPIPLARASRHAPPVNPPSNLTPPTIDNTTPHVGDTLTCDPGTWDVVTSITFQWTRDGSNIDGETASTYTALVADHGHALCCSVTAHNTGGATTDSTDPQPTANVVFGAPPTGGDDASLSSDGDVSNPRIGDTLTINVGTWQNATSFTFSWTSEGSAFGETGSSFIVPSQGGDQFGHTITGHVIAHNEAGDSSEVDTNTTGPVTA